MAGISSIGIGSGLDANGIISQLVALESRPIQALQMKAATVQARISAFGQIQSQFAALSDVLSRIAAPGVWTGRTASSSNSSAATISATKTAPAASFTLDVDALAQAQSVASGSLTAGAAVGGGTLTLRLGSWNADGTSFTPASGSNDVPITVSATDKLGDIAAKINEAKAGVTATIFNDGSGDRLLLKSDKTGIENGFRIQVSDDDGKPTDAAGLSRLAFDPATTDPISGATFGMAAAGLPIQYGADAQARINGLPVTSSTNTLSGNFEGVTIQLVATTTKDYGLPGEVRAPISMAVRQDTGVAVKNVQDFVDAYNALNQSLTTMTSYDAATQQAGPFQGDATIVGLQNILRQMIGGVIGTGGSYQRLSDVGIQVQRDGSLSVNSQKLSAAANNGTALRDLFTADQTDPALDGFAIKMAAFTKGALASSGMIGSGAKALQRQLENNSKEQERVAERVSRMEERLRKQYGALDAQMGRLNALNAYVAQQVTLWNNIKKEG